MREIIEFSHKFNCKHYILILHFFIELLWILKCWFFSVVYTGWSRGTDIKFDFTRLQGSVGAKKYGKIPLGLDILIFGFKNFSRLKFDNRIQVCLNRVQNYIYIGNIFSFTFMIFLLLFINSLYLWYWTNTEKTLETDFIWWLKSLE